MDILSHPPASRGGRSLGLRLLAGTALLHQHGIARLRKRLRALPPREATKTKFSNDAKKETAPDAMGILPVASDSPQCLPDRAKRHRSPMVRQRKALWCPRLPRFSPDAYFTYARAKNKGQDGVPQGLAASA